MWFHYNNLDYQSIFVLFYQTPPEQTGKGCSAASTLCLSDHFSFLLEMSSKEGKTKGTDLKESANVHGVNGDPKIVAIINSLLVAAKQPPRTRVRLQIENIYYLLEVAKDVFKARPPLVEVEVSFFSNTVVTYN